VRFPHQLGRRKRRLGRDLLGELGRPVIRVDDSFDMPAEAQAEQQVPADELVDRPSVSVS
jgi:hypothetical protein